MTDSGSHRDAGPRAGAAGRPGLLDALRAFGVVFGGSVVLVAGAAWSIGSASRAAWRGQVPRPGALLGLAAIGAHVLVAVPWMRAWGATDDEARAPLPGDELVADPVIRSTRAVTIDAPVAAVWPWLAQVGQDRGGFYSYEILENLAGCRLRNADRVHPEWQHREVGEMVMLHWARGVPVARFEPPRALVLEGWGAFVLAPADGGRRTRLLARARVGRRAAAPYALMVEIPHFVMERRMLLGIAARAGDRARRDGADTAESGGD